VYRVIIRKGSAYVCGSQGGWSWLVTRTAGTAPSSVLAAASSSSTSTAAFAITSGTSLVTTLVRRASAAAAAAAAVHVDSRWFGGLVPAGEVMVGAFAGGVVLAVTGAAGVGVPGVRRSIELIGTVAE